MSIGFWQIILILLIFLIVFGSGKLPKVMEDLAKGIKSFRDGMINLERHPKDQEESLLIPLKRLSTQEKNKASSKSKKPSLKNKKR